MHELSIAQSLIEAADEAAVREGATSVLRLRVRIGGLAGVVPDALLFSFDLAAEDTLCAGAALEIEAVPVTARCARCNESVEIQPPYCFVCPTCGGPTPELLTGRELELVSLEINSDEPARA